ncbi:hypothetical protein [Rhizobium leguminosarum]|uniref:hypothetical protein n=1 Tax=Rhizobium leguminosarum TaxID=384 RepID=UPI002E10DA51|nr:hypothetical protein U8Q02_38710 [Rhizobium leguminosarum]
MSYSSLLYNGDNQTRISVLSGDPITDVALLPPFRIYVYRFVSSREAEVFIAGLRIGGGNSIVFDWNPGGSDSNRTVMVGALSEEVDPAATLHERVSLSVVPGGDHDQRAATRAMDELQAERRSVRDRQKAEMLPVLHALSRFAPTEHDFGQGWVRARTEDNLVTVSWRHVGGPFEVDMSANELFNGPQDRSEMIERRALELGCRIGEGRSIEPDTTVADLTGLPDAVARIMQALETIRSDVHAANLAAWKAGVKMTAARRRFIRAAHETGGAHLRTVRAIERASAGAETAGRSEIDLMLRMGWVARTGGLLQVMPEGAAAAGVLPATESSRI